MKIPNWANCSEEELWEFVASHLAKNGIQTILVGGAVVSIYSEGAYKSGDLDFVLENYLSDQLPNVLKEIGFQKKDGRHFKHPLCKHLFIEFQNPPAGIGEDLKIKADERKVDGVIIKIFSPTDCIRDRLASYIHFKTQDGLDQALLVAQRHPFNLSKVKNWCESEGGSKEFSDFQRELKKIKTLKR
jgi:hypothetical protein